MLKVLGALVILAAIAGIVAYSQGWLTFSAQDGDRTKIKMEFNKTKAKEDIKEDIEKAKKAGSDVVDAVKPKN